MEQHTTDAEAWRTILDLAQRGYEDYQHQASYGDYSPAEQATMRDAWANAQHFAWRLSAYLDED